MLSSVQTPGPLWTADTGFVVEQGAVTPLVPFAAAERKSGNSTGLQPTDPAYLLLLGDPLLQTTTRGLGRGTYSTCKGEYGTRYREHN